MVRVNAIKRANIEIGILSSRSEAHCEPWSLWCTQPSGGHLRAMAISGASSASPAAMRGDIDPPRGYAEPYAHDDREAHPPLAGMHVFDVILRFATFDADFQHIIVLGNGCERKRLSLTCGFACQVFVNQVVRQKKEIQWLAGLSGAKPS